MEKPLGLGQDNLNNSKIDTKGKDSTNHTNSRKMTTDQDDNKIPNISESLKIEEKDFLALFADTEKEKNKNYNNIKIIKKLPNIINKPYLDLYILENEDGEKIFCKKYNKEMMNLNEYHLIKNEININEKINHPGILKIKGYYEFKDFALMFYEYCENGTLQDLINKRKLLTEKEVQYFMIQLIISLNYLRNIKIIHGDIMPLNLFLGENMILKLGIFENAEILDQIEYSKDKIRTSFYMSPEKLNRKTYSFDSDIWSLGITMHYLLTNQYPFEFKDSLDSFGSFILNLIEQKEFPIFPSDCKISRAAKDLIKQILVKKPEERPTLNQIIYHDFFNREGIPKYFSNEIFENPPEEYPEEILNKEVIYKDLKSLIKPSLESTLTYENFDLKKQKEKINIKDIDIYITHYYDYYSRFGVGYRLNNGNVGVYYRDKTNMILNIMKNKYIYIEKSESNKCPKMYEKESIPEELSNKLNILEGFKKYFDEKTKEDGDKLSEKEINKNENELIYVEILIFDSQLIFLKLSNQIQNIFFKDNVQIIMSYDTLTYIDKDKNKTNLKLIDIASNPIPILKSRNDYLKKVYCTYMEKKLLHKLEKMKKNKEKCEKGEISNTALSEKISFLSNSIYNN